MPNGSVTGCQSSSGFIGTVSLEGADVGCLEPVNNILPNGGLDGDLPWYNPQKKSHTIQIQVSPLQTPWK